MGPHDILSPEKRRAYIRAWAEILLGRIHDEESHGKADTQTTQETHGGSVESSAPGTGAQGNQGVGGRRTAAARNRGTEVLSRPTRKRVKSTSGCDPA